MRQCLLPFCWSSDEVPVSPAHGWHYLRGHYTKKLGDPLPNWSVSGWITQDSHENPHAARLFASFFIPFYFHEGVEVPGGALVLEALLYGLILSVAVIPIRIGKNWLQARYLSHRTAQGSFRVAIALEPTLIFTLVIAGILHKEFHINDALYGGLLVYAAVTTILPSLVLPGLSIATEPEA
jgi:hypothetical protein